MERSESRGIVTGVPGQNTLEWAGHPTFIPQNLSPRHADVVCANITKKKWIKKFYDKAEMLP